MKEYFNISKTVIRHRLDKLGLITNNMKRNDMRGLLRNFLQDYNK